MIDWYDRELVGYEFALRGPANEAERALEAACLQRFGTICPEGDTPLIRSDNSLIFQSWQFREACAFYRLAQAQGVGACTPIRVRIIPRITRG